MAGQEERESARDQRPDEPWRYERFLATIQDETGVDRDHAERAAMAMLVTLAERITRARAEELGEDLPERLRDWLQDARDQPEELDRQEFIRRVAERDEVDRDAAVRHARAVFHALARVAPSYEVDDLVEELPSDFEPLVGDAARELHETAEPSVRTFNEFVERVKRRAGVDWLEAERAANLVLEALAERLEPGEVEALQAALPEQFGEALQRGKLRVGGEPRPVSLDELVERIARAERISFDEAFARTRAVFVTLTEALSADEIHEILHELPRGYRETLL